jgi:WhiB family redox-sensing transcriptional regulator
MDWLQRAACRGMNAEFFFPERGRTYLARETIAICQTCPVRLECLEYALGTNERFGIWGGMTVSEREQVRERRRREQWDAMHG